MMNGSIGQDMYGKKLYDKLLKIFFFLLQIMVCWLVAARG